MATGLSGKLTWRNMVWEVKTQPMPERVVESQVETVGMDEAFDMLKCNEDLPSSPGCPSTGSHMEYDDLPELQEVQENQASPVGVFQVEARVSHQEGPGGAWGSGVDGASSPHTNTNWLAELANIATSPQSPLLQNVPHSRSSPVHIFATSNSLHSYARPPQASSAPSPARSHMRERRRVRAISESESGSFCMSSLSDDDDMGWSHSWPSTVWHCFLKGTRVRFHKGSNLEWQDVEDLCHSDDESDDDGRMSSISSKGYGSEGLKLMAFEEIVSFGQSVHKLTFDPGSPEDGFLTTECRLDHPFYVKNKGWSSFYPSLTVVQYGIPCYDMHVGDLCLPPGHKDAINCDDSVVFDTFRSYDFTPLDSSAVYVLSSMARQRRASQSSGGAVSPDCDKLGRDQEPSSSAPSPNSKSNRNSNSGTTNSNTTTPTKCKRPMNAFMLFAKKYRVEYTQMYPGKDNRAISVILGDKWKKMKNEERRMYTMEAKALAEEQKRLNPDCWKRKRTNSGSQQN
ncbi:HMG box-containing protein 1 isoform X1 [Clupea harengus]|uniref:HMG box-containing protein 1 n=1 Tax=Clupea harengus TaxID=7950 RepID=A0A8M1KIA4_CLUHA|nr:HMG box-containing protein 1 isoform X1 [Clupea harengus]